MFHNILFGQQYVMKNIWSVAHYKERVSIKTVKPKTKPKPKPKLPKSWFFSLPTFLVFNYTNRLNLLDFGFQSQELNKTGLDELSTLPSILA
jgi:hypothetical protein